jgi:hypothetical protein
MADFHDALSITYFTSFSFSTGGSCKKSPTLSSLPNHNKKTLSSNLPKPIEFLQTVASFLSAKKRSKSQQKQRNTKRTTPCPTLSSNSKKSAETIEISSITNTRQLLHRFAEFRFLITRPTIVSTSPAKQSINKKHRKKNETCSESDTGERMQRRSSNVSGSNTGGSSHKDGLTIFQNKNHSNTHFEPLLRIFVSVLQSPIEV